MSQDRCKTARLAALVLLLAAAPARAADIFVDPLLGDDSRDGLSPPNAVRTVQH